MKKYLATRMRFSALLIAGAIGTFAFAMPQLAEAQNAPEKIRLMADALRARDSGNLNLAQQKAEELIKISPDDENVQRLLASINRELDRTGGNAGAESAAVYGQAPDISLDAAMQAQAGSTGADSVVAQATASQDMQIAAAKDAIKEANQLAKLGAYDQANSLLSAASSSLSLNMATASTLDALETAKADIILTQARAAAAAGDPKAAEALVEAYYAAGGDSGAARRLARDLDAQISDPYALDIKQISPDYVTQSKIIRDLMTRGRAQFLNGDYDGASATFKEVEARDANNAEVKLFQTRIAEILGDIHVQNHRKTRQQMLTEVDQNWERPKVFDITTDRIRDEDLGGRIQDKLNQIVIPQVNFSGMELTRVIETLSELSVEYDPDRSGGVNIIPLFNSNDTNPRVNISLRNLNLDRILQFVTQQVNFAYDVGADAVTIAPSDAPGGLSTTVTEFFPVSRATIIRLTGFRDGPGSSSGPVDPFAAPTGGGSSGPSVSEEVEALQNFFQRAGVNFEQAGASLAFDGEQLIVTQTRRNLERMRTILRNYNEVKQVEIETKFLEVAQNDLEEVGFDWFVGGDKQFILDSGGAPVLDRFGNPTAAYNRVFSPANRTVAGAFGGQAATSGIEINSPQIGNVIRPFTAPEIASTIDTAVNAGNVFASSGWSVNGY
ncbi:MAG: hypothetical protein EA353_13330, partial [Puniceicoccaceae bacterium]